MAAGLPITEILGAIAVLLALWTLGVFGIGALFRRPRHEMTGKRARVLEWSGVEGTILIEGERWKARAQSGDCAGAEEVTIRGRDGLVALVAPVRRRGRGFFAGKMSR